MSLTEKDSMFANYFKELEGADTLFHDHGFIVYNIKGEECYIGHLYVKPEHRGTNIADMLFKRVEQEAKESGAKLITGFLSKADSGNERNISIYKSRGLSILKESPQVYIMGKEI